MRYFVLTVCLFFSFSFSSASQRKEIISKLTIKLEGNKTNISDFIDINGYYSNADFGSGIRANVIFFSDGTYVWQFKFREDATEDSISNNIGRWIYTWIEDKQIRWGNYWGVYRIEGDTIIGNFFVKGSFWRGWSFTEERYKIIDKTTIKKISLKYLLKSDNNSETWMSDYYHFIPADSLPPSDCWLKEEKWIWLLSNKE
ncbi:MAG: hypothetical protein LBT25_08295 [Candidatus Symbiothrix sp.]|jgi:hypothetical protein|nr:hypothetical protein [Candidatus Symbiothrix sp.]